MLLLQHYFRIALTFSLSRDTNSPNPSSCCAIRESALQIAQRETKLHPVYILLNYLFNRLLTLKNHGSNVIRPIKM